MPDSPNYLRQAQITLWVQWVFVCALAWAIGIAAIYTLDLNFTTWPNIAVLTGCLSVGQWLIMRHFFSGKAWLALLWIPLTILGGIIGQTLSAILKDALGVAFLEAQFNPFLALIVGSFMGMLLGFGIGAAQFLVLTIGRMPHAIIWVVVNTIGWGIGLSISAAFVLPLVVSSLLSAIIAAIVTGLGVGYFTTFQQYGAD
jgi:hypothetical protein